MANGIADLVVKISSLQFQEVIHVNLMKQIAGQIPFEKVPDCSPYILQNQGNISFICMLELQELQCLDIYRIPSRPPSLFL
jgi:hypothetical protein